MHKKWLRWVGLLVALQSPLVVAQTIESARGSVRQASVWLASGVDSWFGDKPFKDGGKVTNGELSVDYYTRQDQGGDLNVTFNAQFKLPNVEGHTYLFTGRDDQRDIVTGQPTHFSQAKVLQSQATTDKAFFAGIGRLVSDSVDFRLGFHGLLKPYGQGRYRRLWEPGPLDTIEFSETVFVTIADHIGSTTALSYQHAFSPTLLGRWANALTITQADSKFQWSSSLGAFMSFGGQRVLSMELVANGKQDSGVPVSDYGLQTRWEQPVYKDWLLGQVTFGHFWPRPDPLAERGKAWAVGAGVKMLF